MYLLLKGTTERDDGGIGISCIHPLLDLGKPGEGGGEGDVGREGGRDVGEGGRDVGREGGRDVGREGEM